jgi:phosphoribosylaminoimidazolecarboxamide formyltransferase / IMP cyclohydrolase
MRALISVYEKEGVEELARGLADLGWTLVASGGTAAHLESLGLEVEHVEELTEFPELLGGRVKTLHPRIHAGILARRDRDDDEAALERHEIQPFDLVCVNLYPFAAAAGRRGATETEVIEMIDVGGPAMLRAAAKNFAHVVPVCQPDQFSVVLAELRLSGTVSDGTRRELARQAFAVTAQYEASIARWFGELEPFPDALALTFSKVADLSYGENPHQRAAYYAEDGARRHLLSQVEQLHGKELSFNNLYDLDAARRLVREFALPACVIVKHANPCGVALAATIEEAYRAALAADPVSAFGGVVVLNRPVPGELGERLAEQFVEVLFAPEYDDEALDALRAKPATRILLDRERRAGTAGEKDLRRVIGGLLVQDRDWDVEDREQMIVVAGQATEEQWGDLLFATRVCKHVWSNAIVIAKELRTLGIGGGQPNRVDAVRIALARASEQGHDVRGAVLASDAFFPFPDGPQVALDAGVAVIAQPGGSKRDAEVVQAVQAVGATMVFTGRRHFRH